MKLLVINRSELDKILTSELEELILQIGEKTEKKINKILSITYDREFIDLVNMDLSEVDRLILQDFYFTATMNCDNKYGNGDLENSFMSKGSLEFNYDRENKTYKPNRANFNLIHI